MNADRWGAASGYLVFVLGVAGAAFERGAPPAGAPAAEVLAFTVQYRQELLAQSLMFVLSAGVYLWFFGSLRTYLMRHEGEAGSLASVAFGAGVVWAGLQMVFQSAQVGLAITVAGAPLDPTVVALVSNLAYAQSVIAYVPLGIMLGAVALAALRHGAFPVWLGWLSAVAAAANLVMSLGIAVDSGLLVPGGVLTYLLYAIMAIWPLAVTTAMIVRLGKVLRKPDKLVSGLGV